MRRPALPDDRGTALPHPRRGGRPLSEDPHRWFDAYLDACNRHDLESLRAFLHPDVRRAGAARGADAWLADIASLLAAFPDFRWKRIALVAEDDRIAVHLRTRGTHRGSYQGVAATGRRVSAAEFAFYRVEHGRITEWAGGSDPGLLQQLTG